MKVNMILGKFKIRGSSCVCVCKDKNDLFPSALGTDLEPKDLNVMR